MRSSKTQPNSLQTDWEAVIFRKIIQNMFLVLWRWKQHILQHKTKPLCCCDIRLKASNAVNSKQQWNWEIIPAKNPTEKSSCKYDLKEVQARAEFEHMTSEVPVQRSTNWANKPTGSWLTYGERKPSKWWMMILHIHIFAMPWRDEIKRSSQKPKHVFG